jgi:ubiquitin C-terminal hydrolase
MNTTRTTQAYKRFDVWTTPDVLIIHLKRFQYTPGGYTMHRQKIDDLVDFPIEGLDLAPFMQRCGAPVHSEAPPVYDLYAVSEHTGSLRGGHYTTVARNSENGKWYDFNDGSVREVDAAAAVTPRAYVLFYRRRTGSLRWGGLGQDDVMA